MDISLGAYQIILISEIVVFLGVVFMHLIKENTTLVGIFLIQSLAVSLSLFAFAFYSHAWGLVFSAVLTLLVKVIFAPLFFFRLIRSRDFRYSGSTYLSTPVSLLVIIIITLFVDSAFFVPLESLSEFFKHLIPLALASMIISIFLMINRRGVLSQVIGILSLENSIVVFASMIELEQTFGLELAIAFNIVVWVLIAGIFTKSLHKYFGSLDAASISNLKD